MLIDSPLIVILIYVINAYNLNNMFEDLGENPLNLFWTMISVLYHVAISKDKQYRTKIEGTHLKNALLVNFTLEYTNVPTLSGLIRQCLQLFCSHHQSVWEGLVFQLPLFLSVEHVS